MEFLCILENVGETRSFTKQNGGSVNVVDVTLKSGADVVQASCFDELADAISKGEIKKGPLYHANVRFSVRSGEKGTFQSARVNDLHLVFDNTQVF